jgi:hypothetical protein
MSEHTYIHKGWTVGTPRTDDRQSLEEVCRAHDQLMAQAERDRMANEKRDQPPAPTPDVDVAALIAEL